MWQETKYCDRDSLNPYSVCDGGINIGWVAVDPIGLSGGTWSFWDRDKLEVEDVWAVERAIGVEGKWIASGKWCEIVNIYGSSESKRKIRLWNSLA